MPGSEEHVQHAHDPRYLLARRHAGSRLEAGSDGVARFTNRSQPSRTHNLKATAYGMLGLGVNLDLVHPAQKFRSIGQRTYVHPPLSVYTSLRSSRQCNLLAGMHGLIASPDEFYLFRLSICHDRDSDPEDGDIEDAPLTRRRTASTARRRSRRLARHRTCFL